MGLGAEIDEVERVLRKGGFVLPACRQIQADGFFEAVGAVQAVGPGYDLLQGKASGGHGNIGGKHLFQHVLRCEGSRRRKKEGKYGQSVSAHGRKRLQK